jgi:deoxyadenosine/deoxycytidine kinase
MKLVYITGNIASGKSTLIHQLIQVPAWSTAAETEERLAYLPDLFSNPRRWALESQLAFLASKAALVRSVLRLEGWVAIDRSLYEHAEVFAKLFAETGALEPRAESTYRRIYELLASEAPLPHALVVCVCPPSVCEERLRRRSRPSDELYPAGHLQRLDRLLNEWLQSFQLAPIYTIDTVVHDVRRPEIATAVARDLERAQDSDTTLELLRRRVGRP